jgi:hypothetical protein
MKVYEGLCFAGVLSVVACSGDDSSATHDGGTISFDSSAPADASTTDSPAEGEAAPPDAATVDGTAPDAGATGATCTLDGGAPGTLCSGSCVDTQTDPQNCGGCGVSGANVSCEAGAVCAMGHCQDVVGSLEGLRWSLPCTMPPSGNNCPATNSTPVMTTVKGTLGVLYAVTLRFRGVVEQKTYSGVPDSGAGLAVGTNASFFVVGGTPGGDGYNVYELSVLGPEANVLPFIAYLNSGVSGLSPCFPIDYTVTLPMAAGSTITLTTNTVDGQERANEDMNGTPIVVPGISPYPSAYDGQFVQMDVVSVTPMP